MRRQNFERRDLDNRRGESRLDIERGFSYDAMADIDADRQSDRYENDRYLGDYRRSPYEPSSSDRSNYGMQDYRRTSFGSEANDSGRSQFGTQGSYGTYNTNRQLGTGERHWGHGEYVEHRSQDEKGFFERMGEKVGEFFGKGPKNYKRSDDRIREDACECLWRHPRIDASDVEVQVSEGIITLTGFVPTRDMKRMLEDEIEHLAGVRDVINNVRLSSHRTTDEGSKSDRQGRKTQ